MEEDIQNYLLTVMFRVTPCMYHVYWTIKGHNLSLKTDAFLVLAFYFILFYFILILIFNFNYLTQTIIYFKSKYSK